MIRRRWLRTVWCVAALSLGAAAQADPDPATGSLRFGFVGLHGGVFDALKEFAPPLNLQLTYYTDEDIRREEFSFQDMDVVFLQHLRA